MLDGFSPEETPGPMPGYVGIKFAAPDADRRIWFTILEWTKAPDVGWTGTSLLEALEW